MGWQEPHEDQQEGVPSPASGEENSRHHQYMLGAAQLESSLAEGALSVLVSMDQLCALAAKKADGAASVLPSGAGS